MALVNGIPSDSDILSNRGLAYGDGLFETIACRNQQPRNLEKHYARLRRGCEKLGIAPPSMAQISEDIQREISSAQQCVIKLIVTRGSGGRGYTPADNVESVRIVQCHPWPKEIDARESVAVWLCEFQLSHNQNLAGIKHLNRLEQVLAAKEIKKRGFNEGLLCDVDGRLICGAKSNVFILHDGVLKTPELSRCGVAGVMRDVVRDLCIANNIELLETTIDWHVLEAVDEMFLTNALVEILQVKHVAGRVSRDLTIGPLTRDLQNFLSARAL